LRLVEKALNIFDGMGEFSLPAVIIESAGAKIDHVAPRERGFVAV